MAPKTPNKSLYSNQCHVKDILSKYPLDDLMQEARPSFCPTYPSESHGVVSAVKNATRDVRRLDRAIQQRKAEEFSIELWMVWRCVEYDIAGAPDFIP